MINYEYKFKKIDEIKPHQRVYDYHKKEKVPGTFFKKTSGMLCNSAPPLRGSGQTIATAVAHREPWGVSITKKKKVPGSFFLKNLEKALGFSSPREGERAIKSQR